MARHGSGDDFFQTVIVVVLIAVVAVWSFGGCGDDKTFNVTTVEAQHGKGHNKDCEAKIDSLEQQLEDCKD